MAEYKYQPSNDWRGIHPYATVFRKWFVAKTLRPGEDGVLRRCYACFTRRGAEFKIDMLYHDERVLNEYRRDALLRPLSSQYELVGHLSDHPRRKRAPAMPLIK